VTLVLYEDPLSPWCFVAEQRIRAALEEVGFAYELTIEPFPLRVEPRAPTEAERRALARTARRAAKEPEAAHTTPDLWLSKDAPHTTVPALTALAAARLQGAAREDTLRAAMRDAALVRGINVTRRDVLYELAHASGLDVGRFVLALDAPSTERRVRGAFEDALDKGIEHAPALVIGDEWVVVGAKSAAEYRGVLRRYVAAKLGIPPERTVH
jgi:predicted DsbA family dithiol-disulfide isomerase